MNKTFSFAGTLVSGLDAASFARNSVAYVDGVQVPANVPGYRDVAVASGWNFSNPSHGVTPFACNGTLAVGNKADGLHYSTDGRNWTNFANSTYNSQSLFVTDAGTVLVWTGTVGTWDSGATNGVTLRRIATPTGTPAITTAQTGGGDFALFSGVGLQRQWAWQEGDTICLVTYPFTAAAGGQCKVYRSTDDGANWTLVHTQTQTNAGENNHGHAICYMDDLDWWVACIGDAGNAVFIYSTDDGATWSNLWGVGITPIQPVLLIPANDGSGDLWGGADTVMGFVRISLGGSYSAGTRPPIQAADIGWPTHVIDGTTAATARFCWGGAITSTGILVAGHADNTVVAAEDEVGKRVVSVSPNGNAWTSPVHLPSDSAGIRSMFELDGVLFGSEGYDNGGAYGYRPYELTVGVASAQQAVLVAKPIAAADIRYAAAVSEDLNGASNFASGSVYARPTDDPYSGSSYLQVTAVPSGVGIGQIAVLPQPFTPEAEKYTITCAIRGTAQSGQAQIYARQSSDTPLDYVPISDGWMQWHSKPFPCPDTNSLRPGVKCFPNGTHPGSLTDLVSIDAFQMVKSDNPVEYMAGQVARAGEALSYQSTTNPNRSWKVGLTFWPLYHSYKMSGTHTVLHIASGSDYIKLIYDATNDYWTLSSETTSGNSSAGVWFNQKDQFDVVIEVNPFDDTIVCTINGAGGGDQVTISGVGAELVDGSTLTINVGDATVANNMPMLAATSYHRELANRRDRKRLRLGA